MSESAESVAVFAQVLGRQVRMYRQLAEMTQDDLCEASGLNRTYLSSIENGTANPIMTVLWALANALKVRPLDLLSEKGRVVQPGFAVRVNKRHRKLPLQITRD